MIAFKLATVGVLALACAWANDSAAQAWDDPNFADGVIKTGTFELFDVSEHLGGWRVGGDAGNVAWVSGSYQHHGFNFFSQVPAHKAFYNWVNLAGLSQSKTGVVHRPTAVTVGATYNLTFYVGSVYDPNGVYGTSSTVAVYANTKLLGNYTTHASPGSMDQQWQEFTATFVADKPFVTIAIINGDPPGDLDCGISTVQLTEAANPGAKNGKHS